MGKFVMRRVAAGFRFDLRARNGEIIAASEVYASEAACKNGIESVRKNAGTARLEDRTAEGFQAVSNPKFELYADKRGAYRFRLKARNGEVIAFSEPYASKAACKSGIESVRRNAPDAETVTEE